MTTTRREFLKSGALASGVAVLSMYVPGFGGQEAQAAGSLHTPNVCNLFNSQASTPFVEVV